jgi:hypothetical protein
VSTPQQTSAEQLEALRVEITDTEQAITAATTDLETLAQQTEAGEDVGPAAIPEKRRLLEHLGLVLAGLKARRARAAAAARLDRLTALRAEIEAQVSAGDETFAELVDAAVSAVVAVIAANEEHRAKVLHWRKELGTELVPSYFGQHPEPSPAHAGLGLTGEGLAVGELRIPNGQDRESLLRLITRNADRIADGHPDETWPVTGTTVAPPMDPDLRFFTAEGEGVTVIHKDRVPVAITQHTDLREITSTEAVALWHRRGVTEAHRHAADAAVSAREVTA